MKTKRLYQSPLIRRDEVELEDGFCGSITDDLGKGQMIESATQEYGAFDAQTSDDFDKGNDGKIKWE